MIDTPFGPALWRGTLGVSVGECELGLFDVVTGEFYAYWGSK